MSPRVLRRLVGLSCVTIAAAYLFVATQLEQRTIASRAPVVAGADARARHVDREALMADVRTLASREFEGRRTGSRGGRMAREYLVRRFAEVGTKPASPSGFAQPFRFVHQSIRGFVLPGRPWKTSYDDAANVVGVLPGTQREPRTIVVSAHYDHLGVREGTLYPGADDNASGVAVLLATARHFSSHPPRHSLLFVAFDAEELGLAGAEAFMRNPPVPPERIALNVNLDMIARNDRNEIFAAGAHHTPSLEPILRGVQRRSAVKILLGHDRPMYRAGRVEDWTGLSDHKAFHDAGIPFVYFAVEDHEDYHRPTDTADRIDPRFFGDVGDTIVEAVAILDRTLE